MGFVFSVFIYLNWVPYLFKLSHILIGDHIRIKKKIMWFGKMKIAYKKLNEYHININIWLLINTRTQF
jgi:hypothetical protein